jgi:hypothetical protein
MPRETLIGSYLLRLTRQGSTGEGSTHERGRTRIVLRDLRRNEVLEFETWVAAWAFVDTVLHDCDDEPTTPRPCNGAATPPEEDGT